MNLKYSSNTLNIFISLGPLVLLLIISQIYFGTGQNCYLFWNNFSYNHSIITNIVKFITNYGNPLFYFVYAFILIRAMQNKYSDDIKLVIWYITIQILIAVIVTHFLKNMFGMPRPFSGETQANPWAFKAVFQSFPSGHTVEIVGACLPLALWRKKRSDALFCGLIIAMVGYSRVYLGRHYLMDIWGGIILGCISTWLILKKARN